MLKLWLYANCAIGSMVQRRHSTYMTKLRQKLKTGKKKLTCKTPTELFQ